MRPVSKLVQEDQKIGPFCALSDQTNVGIIRFADSEGSAFGFIKFEEPFLRPLGEGVEIRLQRETG